MLDWIFKHKKRGVSDSTYTYLDDSVKFFYSTGFFKDNPLLVEVYQDFLLRAGKCPMCGDFLFVDVKEEYKGGGYKVVKDCVNLDCSYSLDISREFNEKLGFKYPEDKKHNTFKNPPSHYYSLDIGFDDKNKVYKGLGRNAYGVRDTVGLYGNYPIFHNKKEELENHKIIRMILDRFKCPCCDSVDWIDKYVINHEIYPDYYSVICSCVYCNNTIDISDYYKFFKFIDENPSLLGDLGIGCLDDCRFEILGFPMSTGTLKSSFEDSVEM